MTIKPPALKPGDQVALFSISSPIPSEAHLARMIDCLESFGLQVITFPSTIARYGYLAGADDLRLENMNRAIASPEIRAIFFAWGGSGANHLLPHIDYAVFQRTPKIVVGLSDPSCVLNALTARTGVITFHGPTGVNFAAEEGLPAYTRESFVQNLFAEGVFIGEVPSYSPWEILKPGQAKGPLFGGHLTTIQTLLGTPYAPNWDGCIFFWEEIGKTPRAIDKALSHFKLAGVLERIAGMVVGRPLDCADPDHDAEMDIRRMVIEICREYDFPILFNVDLGHTDPKLTLPIGALAELQLQNNQPAFTLLESGVTR